MRAIFPAKNRQRRSKHKSLGRLQAREDLISLVIFVLALLGLLLALPRVLSASVEPVSSRSDSPPPASPTSNKAPQETQSARSSVHSRHCAADRASDASSSPTFALQFGDEVSPYPLISTFRLPGEWLDISVVLADREPERFTACWEGSDLSPIAAGQWRLVAPDRPGVTDITVLDRLTGEAATLRLFTMDSYGGAEAIGDFRVGAYEQKPLRGLDAYKPPGGFIRVDRAQVDLNLSPHFRLGQFLSKQTGDFPKYALVSTRLLLKLERLLEEVQSAGVAASTFTIMSGFRTPWYNRSIGNTTEYSRHLYGDAADIFVDSDHDGRMDDLDHDGNVGYSDAVMLAQIIERAAVSPWYRPFVGGLGIYGPAPHRGPFIHIDTRGYAARWTAP